MRRFVLVLAAALISTVAAPAASAKECTTNIKDLCKFANDTAKLDSLFGDYADFGLIFLGLLVLVVVLTIVVWLISGPFPGPRLKAHPREAVREVEPGGDVSLVLDVENPRRRAAVDVAVEPIEIPEGWTFNSSVVLEYPSGFRATQELAPNSFFHLPSRSRADVAASVLLQVHAAQDAAADQPVDVVFRAVPIVSARRRDGKAKRARFAVLVTTKLPIVQITNVSHDPPRIQSGVNVVTRAHLVNRGEREAKEVPVSFLLNGNQVERKVVPALAAQQETDIEFRWTAVAGENKIRVSVG